VIPIDAWLRAALAGDPSLAILRDPLQSPPLRPYVDAFARGRLAASRLWALAVRERFLRASIRT
jgi:hypothetical protein